MIPHSRQPVTGSDGLATRPWYDAFQRIEEAQRSGDTEAIAAELRALAILLGSPDGTVAGIPPQQAGKIPAIFGGKSVTVFSNGERVELALTNDALQPGNRTAYGTDGEGERGFFPIADALVEGAAIELTTGADGRTTFDLATLPDSGIGDALVKLTRDAYGRVEGTQAVTAADVASRITLTSTAATSALRAVAVESGVARYPDTSVASDAARVVGIAVTSGTTFDVVTAGEVVDASWAWSPGIVWCGADGVLTQAPPAGWVLEIGRALDATRLFVAIKTPFLRN